MKKVLLALLLATGGAITTSHAQNQPINNSFEAGTDTIADFWMPLGGHVARITEKTFNLQGGGTATQKAADGTYFMELRPTVDSNNRASLGTMSLTMPYTNRPKKIDFSVMYIPGIATDRFTVGIYFTKFNTSTGKSELVSNYTVSSPAGQAFYPWTPLSAGVQYVNEDTPDSLTMIIWSNHPASQSVGLGTSLFIDNIKFAHFTGVEDGNVQIGSFNFFPNPMKNSSTIEYSISERENVNLVIRDITGREVATLVNESVAAGTHQVKFERNGLKPGVYIYRLQAGNQEKTGKIIIAD